MNMPLLKVVQPTAVPKPPAQVVSLAVKPAPFASRLLARCLEKYPGDHDIAFARYEAARRDRANKVVTGSADQIARFRPDRVARAALPEHRFARGCILSLCRKSRDGKRGRR